MSRRCLPTAASLSRHHLRFLQAIDRTRGYPFALYIDRDKRAAERLAERLSPQFVRICEGGRSADLTDAGRAALLAWGQS